ncbi:hypothetical protein D8674_010665 [Pyrus ussuriensis x Pyrus communis]|uniref:Uncharacterized protein n=1 Tax=Pyrus ussuriensis x Pyrus communis TaxID=2448454 RepID=A0A5N5FQ68_9ROSA|nr:hypothetical protein D8674_010665 [Pyrus ussuriensis x Pyrus communis]
MILICCGDWPSCKFGGCPFWRCDCHSTLTRALKRYKARGDVSEITMRRS